MLVMFVCLNSIDYHEDKHSRGLFLYPIDRMNLNSKWQAGSFLTFRDDEANSRMIV